MDNKDNPFIPQEVIKKRRTVIERYFEFIDSKRPSDKLLFYGFLLTVLISGTLLLLAYNESKTTVVPTAGGTLHEGIVGSPRFVNPILAITRADQDMTSLIFDSLMTIDEQGELIPEIAESVTISSDALVYNVVLRQDVTFHDGTPLTADDVLFTFELIQNPVLKSPLQGNFDGVVIERIGDYEVNFVLEEPYTPFIDNLLVGILPKHEWQNLSIDQIPFSQHNTEPVGSGPYRIKSVKRNNSGLISGYILEAYRSALHQPKIETLEIAFYANEQLLADALIEGKVNSATGLSVRVDDITAAQPTSRLLETPLPRTFGLFLNQNKSAALRQAEVREVLEMVIDRDALIEAALNGRAVAIDTPIPAPFSNQEHGTSTEEEGATPDDVLSAAGWSKNGTGVWTKEIDGSETELTVDIATANLPFLADTAAYLETVWTELGARVSVRQFEQTDLTQAVIRTRDYEALLFGTALGRSLDFYPFWHSSQRNDPGLNVALYANISTDAALEDARTSTSTEARDVALETFLTEFSADQPAIFLYVPTIVSIAPENLMFTPIQKITAPHERLANIDDWYIRTESVWPIFNK